MNGFFFKGGLLGSGFRINICEEVREAGLGEEEIELRCRFNIGFSMFYGILGVWIVYRSCLNCGKGI